MILTRGLQRAGFDPETRTGPGPESGSGPANFILKPPGPGPGWHLIFIIFSGPVRVQSVNPDFLYMIYKFFFFVDFLLLKYNLFSKLYDLQKFTVLIAVKYYRGFQYEL